MMFRALRPHRRNCLPSLAAGAAALLLQVVLAVVVQWRPSPVPLENVPTRRAPTRVSALTFIPLPNPGEASRVEAPPAQPPRRAEATASPAATSARGAGRVPARGAADSASFESPQPHGLFDHPFTPARDVRFIIPPSSATDSLAGLRYRLVRASADAVVRARAADGALDWTLGHEDARFGLSPGRLHLGRLSIPIPVAVRSLRDADPRIRQQQAMLREVREQADRRERLDPTSRP